MQITFVSTLAHLPLYLPLRVCHRICPCAFISQFCIVALAGLLLHNLPPTNPWSAGGQSAYDQTWVLSIHAKHAIALDVIVIGDQLTSLKTPFYMRKGNLIIQYSHLLKFLYRCPVRQVLSGCWSSILDFSNAVGLAMHPFIAILAIWSFLYTIIPQDSCAGFQCH